MNHFFQPPRRGNRKKFQDLFDILTVNIYKSFAQHNTDEADVEEDVTVHVYAHIIIRFVFVFIILAYSTENAAIWVLRAHTVRSSQPSANR